MVILFSVTKKQAGRRFLFENQTGGGKCRVFRQDENIVHCGPCDRTVQ